MQSKISKIIDTSKQEAQYDACVKRILSEKIILAWILKECVDEFKQYSIPQIMKECIEGEPKISTVAVDQDELDYTEDIDETNMAIEGQNTEDNSIKEGKVYYDIRFYAVVPDTKEPIHLIINIEAQKSDKTTYPIIKRAIYYVSRMISAQKNKVFTKSHYEKIRKVYSIWIHLNVDADKANSITKYRITEEQVAGNVSEKESDYDLLTIIMLRLGAANEAGDRQILRLLDVLLSADMKPNEKKSILEKDFDIPMSAKMSEEANVMCNLGEGIREQAYEKAYEKATQSTRIDDVLNLMKSFKISAEEAINALCIPDKERQSILDMVGKRLAAK